MLLSDQLNAKYSIVPFFGTETLRYLNHFERACSAHWEIFLQILLKPAIWKKELDLRVRFVALAEFQKYYCVKLFNWADKTFSLKVVKKTFNDSCTFMAMSSVHCTTVPHCKENTIYVLPEKKLRGLSPNVHIHISVSDLYSSMIGPPDFLQHNRHMNVQ
jgi:hypothetical protein